MAKTNYTILLICEGENTEPLIFNSIRDRIYDNFYDLDAKIKIIPEPKVSLEELNPVESPHKRKRKKRQLKNTLDLEPSPIKGVPPLKWVLAGQEELRDGTYDEVWTIFDNDNHPAKEEAFKKAKEPTNGKYVNIAFSSRSIEYYFLVHFERKYHQFSKTECKEGKISIECGTDIFENDCQGYECINGYARKNNYWDDSKGKVSFFELIEPRLTTGFMNASWIRFQSNLQESETEIFNRNPYLTIDLLIKRLTNFDDYEWIWFAGNTRKDKVSISVQNYDIEIMNISDITIIIPPNSYFKIDSNNKTYFGERRLLSPNSSYKINIRDRVDEENLNCFAFKFERDTFLFEIQ